MSDPAPPIDRLDAPWGYALALGGALALSVTAAWVGGPLGLLVGPVALVGWFVLGLPVGIGLAHLGVLTVTSPTAPPGLAVLIAFEGGVFMTLLADLDTVDRRTALAALVVYAGGGGVMAVALTTTDALWVVGIAVLGVLGVAAYGLHRYELLVLGKLTEAPE